MLQLIFLVTVFTVVLLGDIIWDFTSEAIWHIGLRFPGMKLNFDKRRRPKKKHYKYM